MNRADEATGPEVQPLPKDAAASLQLEIAAGEDCAASGVPLSGIQVAALWLDDQLRIRGFTPAMEQILGLTAKDQGRPIGELEERLGRGAVADIVAVHQQTTCRQRQLWLGQPPRFFTVRVIPCNIAESDGLVVTMVDLTELREAQLQRDHLAAIVECSDDAIIGTDAEGIITTWNPAARRMFGFVHDDMTGRPLADYFEAERRAELLDVFAAMRRGHHPDTLEATLRRSDGSELPASVRISPIFDEGGRFAGASAIARDVTQQREAEARLARKAELLARSNAELELFASVISHDLRSPMLSIEGCAELIGDYVRHNENPAEALRMLRDSVRHLAAVIKGLLNYARLGAKGVNFGPCNCEKLLQDVLQALRSLVDERHASISRDALPVILGDEKLLPQVFQNLLENALKYSGDAPPRIHLSAEQQPEAVLFRIRDEGIGMSLEDAERIFEPFQRLHEIRAGGFGLGLATCRKIVECHGGRIWAESQQGRGTTFCFTLPRPPEA